MVDAPRLERLLIWEMFEDDNHATRLSIGHAPNLQLLGYLRPGIHVLENGNTIVKVHAPAVLIQFRSTIVSSRSNYDILISDV